MSNYWDKTTIIKNELVRELLFSQFSVHAKNIQFLGEGFDNTAFLINDEFVFRFPHRNEALICMENEIMLLPYLSSKLSFSIPSPTLIGHATSTYPYPFAGYKILPGEILSKTRRPLINHSNFSKTLGSMLKALHSLQILDNHRLLLKGEHDWRLNVVQRTEKIKETLEKYADYYIDNGFEIESLLSRMNYFKNLNTGCKEPSYIHGDLYAKHIIINNGLPTGLIDWGDLHIGHPGIDLSVGIMIFSKEYQKIFFDSYGSVDCNVLEVAIFRAYYHSILAFAYFAKIKELTSILWTKSAIWNSIALVDSMYK